MQLKKILQSFPKQKESFDLLINTEIAKKHVSGLRLMDQQTVGSRRSSRYKHMALQPADHI